MYFSLPLSKSSTVILLSIVTSVLSIIFIPIWSPSFTHLMMHSHYQRLMLSQEAKISHCVMYDKTPRTGSSTILSALRECWGSHGYVFHSKTSSNRNLSFVRQSLSLSNTRRIAIAGNHFMVSKQDVSYIAKDCERFFYVTSTRDMRGRIISKAKFDVSKANVYINTTLDNKRMEIALKRALNDRKTEKRLEKYPFRSLSRMIPPDYVIRYASLRDDLNKLLHSFNCNETFNSRNIHAFSNNSDSTNNNQTIADMNGESTKTNFNADDEVNNEITEDQSTEEEDMDKLKEDSTDEDEENFDDEADDYDSQLHSVNLFDESYINLSAIPLQKDDARHKRMLKLAEHVNWKGLEKAREFQ